MQMIFLMEKRHNQNSDQLTHFDALCEHIECKGSSFYLDLKNETTSISFLGQVGHEGYSLGHVRLHARPD